MKLKALKIDVESVDNFVLINSIDAKKFDVKTGEKIHVYIDNRSAIGIVRETPNLIKEGYVGLNSKLFYNLGGEQINDKTIEIKKIEPAFSLEYIRKKFKGFTLNENEIFQIIKDISEGKIGELEMLMLIFSIYYNGLNLEEIVNFSKAMAETGNKINIAEKTVDKHSIGGVPGNKVSLLIVPTVAYSELYIPKTSSKAITSPSGTADTMSVIANVELEASELVSIVKKTHGCIAWTGKLGITPADDLIIQVEKPVRIDPEGLMIASILSKKIAMGIKYMVVDIPFGKGTKVEDFNYAIQLAQKFNKAGQTLSIRITSAITYGSQPVGHTVGPALEAKEALESLINPNKAATSLLNKSASLAGLLFENVGLVQKGLGYEVALSLIMKGKAYVKMKEIIEAQGGDPNIKPEDVPIGRYVYDISADREGYITMLDNNIINNIARMLGAPHDKGAGIYIYKKQNYKVLKGEPVMRLYSNSESKIDATLKFIENNKPFLISGMLLESYPI